ncbi:MAG: GAF domain-containing protein [Acidobacteriota bacterium]
MGSQENYRWALGQIRKKVKDHINIVSTLANSAAILKERFPDFFWVGFYFFKNDHLLLGPFQGPPACVRLSLDKGVCADSAVNKRSIVVPDVHKYPGHVPCDSRSNSEIVVPLFNKNGELKAVLDVDSKNFDDFNNIDRENLEKVAELLKPVWE